jgi:peptidyl-prolyl cis-trans isomerase A (cyclophilin A)
MIMGKSVRFFALPIGVLLISLSGWISIVPALAAEPETPANPGSESVKQEVSGWPEKAPDVFKVKFECSNGDILIEVHKEWAPLGVEHFYQLVREGFYDEARFFRVVPDFMVQFGMNADPEVTKKWSEKSLKDDPVKQKNTPGMVTYAKTGAPNSRTTQLFVNTGNNTFLDGQGFAPFGKVLEGLDVVRNIEAKYGERPDQMQIRLNGNAYLEKSFPDLDYIKKASLVK